MGVIVSVFRAAPLPHLPRVLRTVSVCLAALLLLQPFSSAQSPSPVALQSNSQEVEKAAPLATGPAAQDETRVSEIPTASQIESAPQPPSDSTDEPAVAQPQQATGKQLSASNTATHPGPLPAKYDVSLIGQRNVGSGLDFYSLDREVALGRQLSAQVEQTSKLVSDPQINEYINRVGQNLVRNSDARVPFTIKVLDNEEVNAFALPGGFFFVDSGLILTADNEAELAGVMAHEIAHVAARHATKNMTRAQIWNMASIPLIFVGGPVAYAISEVASIAVPMGFLKFSRDAEREADLLGLEYDYAAGYDPQAFVQFFEKLNVDGNKKHSRLVKAFSTHPMNADRIQAAQDEIRKYLPDRPEYIVDTSDFQDMKARLMALENGRRLGGKGGDPTRPVLLRRTKSGTSDSDSTDQKGDGNKTDQKDDGHPTLKRNTSD